MIHLIALPHTRMDTRVPTCAYTAKVKKFKAMHLERELTIYGTEGANLVLLDEDERTAMFGSDDDSRMPFWPDDSHWQLFNTRAVEALRERVDVQSDLVLLAGGSSQARIREQLPEATVCEPFVGYEGIATDFCAFESHAWRHHVYGQRGIVDGRWFDTVIPNYFDPADFPHLNRGDGEYLLFLGRVTARKGPQVAADVAKAVGIRLLIAGPGIERHHPGRIIGDHVEIEGHHVEYIGLVAPPERAELLAGACALICPTLYIEPFGGVAVEAMMCGTPVIASDFGAFTETIDHGETGFRFSVLAEGVAAVERLGELAPPAEIRRRTIERFSLDAVAPMFDRWFSKLETLRSDGWYTAHEPRSHAETTGSATATLAR